MGFLGLNVIRTLKWAKMPQWHAIAEIILGIVVMAISFMRL